MILRQRICKNDQDKRAYRGEFYGDQWFTGPWGSDLSASGTEPLYVHFWIFLVPQLVDKIGADAIRMDFEVPRIVGFYGPTQEGEMFENVSEGRDEIENSLLHRMVRLGYRWEKVEGRGPDERNNEVQSVNFYWAWAGKTEGFRRFHSDRSDDWLRHWVVGRGEGGERGR